jgi:hypothetical protein
MATPCAPASSRKRSTVASRSSTDGAFRAAAKPTRRCEFPFARPIGAQASRLATLTSLEVPDDAFSHALVTSKRRAIC